MEHRYGMTMEGSAILWTVIVAAVVIIALVLILTRTGGTKDPKTVFSPEDSFLEMLKKRYAAG